MNKSLLFLIAILLLNCTTKPNHEEIAISKVKETILDSNSFELVKLEKDTTLLSEILLFQHHSYQRLSKECEEMANLAFRDLASLREQKPANFQKYEEIVLKAANDRLDSVKSYAKKLTTIQIEMDSIIGTKYDTIIEYTYMIRGYATSKGGDKVIGDWKVVYDENYNFMDIPYPNILTE